MGDTLSPPFFPPSPEMQRQPAATPCRDMLDFTIPTLTPPPPPHPTPPLAQQVSFLTPRGAQVHPPRCGWGEGQALAPTVTSPFREGRRSLGRGLCSDTSTHPHLDSWEGDRRGGIGSNHQGNKCGPKVTKHVGQLKDKKQGKLLLKEGQTGRVKEEGKRA